MPEYQRNHYVPRWYQKRFLTDDNREQKFYYLDLRPEKVTSGNRTYRRKSLLRWGTRRCFYEDDLYATRFGDWKSTEIEEQFFGRVDVLGRRAVEYFANFEHPGVDPEAFENLLVFMSIQKLRTPKGLAYLADLTGLLDKNLVLLELQRLQRMFCALWAESVWSLVDASQSKTKFIVSDHPVTVYNRGCFPGSRHCRGHLDPETQLSGTHTFFPLNLNRALILTNLSWVRNPYSSPIKLRPNPGLFRSTYFDFQGIQTGRELTDVEVQEMNFVVKKRSSRYVAAAEEAWLFPERSIQSRHWDKLGNGYLFMPDPRSVGFHTETIFGYEGSRTDAFDEYGRKPGQRGFGSEAERETEYDTFRAFQGEFARLFGPRRRGRSFQMGRLDDEEDDLERHERRLELESQLRREQGNRGRNRRRGKRG